MAESKIVGVRFPGELLSQVDRLVGVEGLGKNRSEVVLALVGKSLGTAPEQNLSAVLERLERIEQKLGGVLQQG